MTVRASNVRDLVVLSCAPQVVATYKSGSALVALAMALTLCVAPAMAQGAHDEANLYRDTDAFGARIDKGTGAGQSAATSTGQSFKLSGGVSHAERLEPLPEGERTGAYMPEVIKQKLTIPPKRTFTAAPVVDKTTANLPDVQRQAALKSQPAKVDTAMAEYKRNMQEVINANLRAGATNSYRTGVPGVGKPGASVRPGATGSARSGASTNTSNGPNLSGRAASMAASMAAFKNSRGGLKGSASAAGKIKVPHWLAGVWQRNKSNEISRTELPSGKALKALGEQAAVVTDVFGTFKDKSGQTWMVTPTSGGGAVDRGSAVDYHKVRQYELVETGATSCMIKVRAAHYVMDKKTNRILAAYQDEEFNSYKQVSPGLVKTESSVKVFDELGSPRLLTKAVSMEKRTKQL